MDAKLPKGLSGAHFGVLNHLIRVSDGQSPLVLAHAFQVPKTTMTHTLAGLVKHALVKERPNPKDGRSKQIWLTAKGRAFRDKCIADLAPYMLEMMEQFPPDKIATLVSALVEIRKAMDADRSK